ncbi:MAG: DUF5681 domain-containing protein [Pseudomonadota bacterium]
MSARKNGEKTERDGRGRFGPGNPGRPKGARHKATRTAEALLDGEAEALTRKAIEAALGGDTTALRLCLDRILPARKGRPVQFEIGALENTQDLAGASRRLLEAVANGDLTPEEAQAVGSVIEATRRMLETEELERRISVLEGRT